MKIHQQLYIPPRIIEEFIIIESQEFIGTYGGKIKVFSEEVYEDEKVAERIAANYQTGILKCSDNYNKHRNSCSSCRCREIGCTPAGNGNVINKVLCQQNDCCNF